MLLVIALVVNGLSPANAQDEGRSPSSAASQCTTELEVSGTIGPASLDILQTALRKTAESKCSSLLLLVNTPGGSLQSTRLIVEEILNSPVPILCLVHPAGGHAGSAGAIILQACHVTGAIEATNLGAATPVAGGGQELPEDLRKKILNDTRSWVEGLAKLRNRNVEFAKEIVTEAKAVSAKEAAELKAIDSVVQTKMQFLEFSDGREVRLSEDRSVTVQVGDLITVEHGLRYKLISLVADPQTAYLMFMGSLALLYFEITHPGMIVPGVVGGVGLVLSLISLHKLDVTWGGILLILLGLAFMIAEAFVPSFGMLGIGGVVSFIVGSIFLFDPESSGYALPLSLILPTAIALGAITLLIAYMAFNTRKVKRWGDVSELIGATGRVVEVGSISAKQGMIEISGETWKVKSKSELNNNSEVRVIGQKGLTLEVEPVKES